MGELKEKTIAILGLSFKPNTDDIREAPSLYIIRRLLTEKAKIRVYDPVVRSLELRANDSKLITYCNDPYEAAKGAHVLVIVTEWNQFRNLELERIRKLLKEPNFFDFRNIYEPQKLKESGFKYFCVGRS